MTSKIKSRDLPALLFRIHRDQREGLLLVKNHSSKHGIFFREGKVIHAFTNREDLKLESYIRANNLVEEERLDEVLGATGGRHVGPALVEAGLLSESELRDVMNKLAAEIVVSIFTIPEFTIHFEKKPYKPAYAWHAELYIPNLIIKGIRKIAGWEAIFKDLRRGKLVMGLSTSILDYFKRLDLSAEEGFLLSRINGQMTLREILSLSHLDEQVTLKCVYGLLAAGVLVRCGCQVKNGKLDRGGAARQSDASSDVGKVEEALVDLDSLAEIETMSKMVETPPYRGADGPAEADEAGDAAPTDTAEPAAAAQSAAPAETSVEAEPAIEAANVAATQEDLDEDDVEDDDLDDTLKEYPTGALMDPFDTPACGDDDDVETLEVVAGVASLSDTNKIPSDALREAMEQAAQERQERLPPPSDADNGNGTERTAPENDYDVFNAPEAHCEAKAPIHDGRPARCDGEAPVTHGVAALSARLDRGPLQAREANGASARRASARVSRETGRAFGVDRSVLKVIEKNSMTCQEIRLAFSS